MESVTYAFIFSPLLLFTWNFEVKSASRFLVSRLPQSYCFALFMPCAMLRHENLCKTIVDPTLST